MNNIYYILAANVIMWAGIFALLLRIDCKLKKLEDKCRKES